VCDSLATQILTFALVLILSEHFCGPKHFYICSHFSQVMLDMIKCPRLGVRRVLNQNVSIVTNYIWSLSIVMLYFDCVGRWCNQKNQVIFVATVSWLFYSSFSENYGWKIFSKKVSICHCYPPKRHISRTFLVS